MKYRVHQLSIKLTKDPEKLEQFLNKLEGDVVSVIPNVDTLFLCYGSKVSSVLIVEKIKEK